jgi:hypothetical protein
VVEMMLFLVAGASKLGDMVINTGTEYEKLVQGIFNAILNQESVDNIKAEHNLEVQGKTTKHQIDVYWEFEHGGITYKTIVECKYWKNPVNKGELLKFSQILQDIPGQPRGVFVTKTGYQKGAKEVAIANGIILYELRELTDKDWDGSIREININLILKKPNVIIKPIVDVEWCKTKLREKGHNSLSLHISENRHRIVDENNNTIDIESIIESLIQRAIKEDKEQQREHLFDSNAFLLIDNEILDKIKIIGVEIIVNLMRSSDQIKIKFDEMIKFILKNVINKDIKYFDKNLKTK